MQAEVARYADLAVSSQSDLIQVKTEVFCFLFPQLVYIIHHYCIYLCAFISVGKYEKVVLRSSATK